MQHRRGVGESQAVKFLDCEADWTVGGGVVAVLWSFGAKVRWCGDTFHPPEKLTLYLKVTPFDSKTPTHQRLKVPIGGYVLHSFTA